MFFGLKHGFSAMAVLPSGEPEEGSIKGDLNIADAPTAQSSPPQLVFSAIEVPTTENEWIGSASPNLGKKYSMHLP